MVKMMPAVLDHFDRLKESGLSEEQAKVIASISHEAREQMETALATKKDLELLKRDVTIKIYSMTTVQIGVILAFLKLFGG